MALYGTSYIITTKILSLHNSFEFYYYQEIYVLGDRTVARPIGQTNIFIEDMSEMIPLRNPENGELTGDEVPIAAVYQALYSFYWMKALERDAAMAVSEDAQQEPD